MSIRLASSTLGRIRRTVLGDISDVIAPSAESHPRQIYLSIKLVYPTAPESCETPTTRLRLSLTSARTASPAVLRCSYIMLAAVAQICSRGVVADNLAVCASVVRRAAQAGAKLIWLPEASDYISTEKLMQPLASSSFVTAMRDSAKAHSIWVGVGVHESTEDPARCYNSNLVRLGDKLDLWAYVLTLGTAHRPYRQDRPGVSKGEDRAARGPSQYSLFVSYLTWMATAPSV